MLSAGFIELEREPQIGAKRPSHTICHEAQDDDGKEALDHPNGEDPSRCSIHRSHVGCVAWKAGRSTAGVIDRGGTRGVATESSLMAANREKESPNMMGLWAGCVSCTVGALGDALVLALVRGWKTGLAWLAPGPRKVDHYVGAPCPDRQREGPDQLALYHSTVISGRSSRSGPSAGRDVPRSTDAGRRLFVRSVSRAKE